MRVLAISADRSKRGVLFLGTPAFKRQEAYAKQFGNLDIIVFSRKGDGAKLINTGALFVRPTNSLSRFLYGLDALLIALRLPRPDVITVQDPFEAGFVAWLIARLRGVPLHVQVHTDFLSPAYAQLSVLNRARALFAGFVLRRSARIRVVSERIGNSIREQLRISTPSTTLPVFMDIEVMRVGLHDHALETKFSRFTTKLLVVARFEQEKNVERAITAFAKVALNDACLILVGDGSLRQRLEHTVKWQGIPHVFFEGVRDAAPYYALADLVLVPSLYEGYGLVIVEALAAGKPVLSTDVGIAREAGAIITTPERFAESLAEWFKSGPRTGELRDYPYKNFEAYVHAYCEDIATCTKEQ